MLNARTLPIYQYNLDAIWRKQIDNAGMLVTAMARMNNGLAQRLLRAVYAASNPSPKWRSGIRHVPVGAAVTAYILRNRVLQSKP